MNHQDAGISTDGPGDVIERLLGELVRTGRALTLREGEFALADPGPRKDAIAKGAAAIRALAADVAQTAVRALAEVRLGGGRHLLEAALGDVGVFGRREADLLDRCIKDAEKALPRVPKAEDIGDAEPAVLKLLQRTKGEEGRVVSNRANMALVLENDTRWKGRLRYNEFSSTDMVDADRTVTDRDLTEIAVFLETSYRLTVSTRTLGEVVSLVARSAPFNPVVDYLRRVRWDGERRIDKLLSKYFGADETPLHAAYSRCWLIGCVARAFRPGCRLESMLVLQGEQGALKSSTIRALLPDTSWFSDSQLDLSSKDRFQVLNGIWIYEIAELDSWSKHDQAIVKNFITSATDNYRRSFGHRAESVPRRTAFISSTNAEEFLRDPTGSRRQWPVRVGEVNPEGAAADRDQLWAEAVVGFQDGERWWLDQDLEAERVTTSEEFRETDVWTGPVLEWLRANPRSELKDIAVGALQLRVSDVGKLDQQRISAILLAAGGRKVRDTKIVNTRKAVRWSLPAQGCDPLQEERAELQARLDAIDRHLDGSERGALL